ncbi:sensor histidine kinase [Streptacidiphilus carbonis]|uniref:sensor histidine kinase n=1 Tax=Streptacidiphilus carbonis TaxID=105422 RepID=UPI000A01D39B|nr:histidine kinase [Streptacidiphilus carbonis]
MSPPGTGSAGAGPPATRSEAHRRYLGRWYLGRPHPGRWYRSHWYLSPWITVPVPVLLSVFDALLANDLTSVVQMSTSLAAAAALLLRRRWPLVVMLLTLPGLQLSYIWLAPMIALYSLAAAERRRWVVGGCALLLAVAQFLPWPYSDVPVQWDRTTALAAMYSLMTAIAPVVLGLLVLTRRELAVRLDELTRGQEREQRLLAHSVLSTERARLAREMHDVVSHQVSLISIQAGALQVRADDPAATAEGARTIRQLSVKTLEELRQMVGVLRAAGGDGRELSPQPTLADLPRLVAASGLDAVLDPVPDRPSAPAWPEPVERAAYRTVQESLTNIRKYAPGAAVTVRVRADGVRLQVEVRNGPAAPGAEPLVLPSGGHGLVGLRERAQQLGGSLLARPTEEGGYLVSAVLPFRPEGSIPAQAADD